MGKIVNAGSHHASNPAEDVRVQNWYNHPWDAVLRPTNSQLAELSANVAIAAANNNNIIYIYGGTSYKAELQKANNDPSAITVQCGTDCMGMVFQNIKAAARQLGIDVSGVADIGCGSADTLMKIGYQKFTDRDHVATDANAQRGDVYVMYSQHACMHVGDGNMNGSSTGTGGVGTGAAVSLNIEAMSPYVLRVPENDTSFNCDVFKDSQISGLAFSAGYLYDSKTHVEQKSYINKNLHKQVERATKNGLPFALIAEVRARTVAEAKKECNKLYYVCASAVPEMSLWLHLDFTTSKSTNHRILDYYVEECSKWGFKRTLGVYATKDELKKIDWDDYSEDLYLWRVDHTLDVDKYVGVLPFSTYTGGTVVGGMTGSVTGTAAAQVVINAAKSQLGVPYLWGGDTPGVGFDCSGLTQYAYRVAGINIPHQSQAQKSACLEMGGRTYPLSQAVPGDLLVWSGTPGAGYGNSGHVAIYIGNRQMIEAPYIGGVVQISPVRTPTWVCHFPQLD